MRNARRFVQSLLDLKLAVEEPLPRENRTRACRITHKSIYRELGVPNIRHRRLTEPGAYLRRLLSLDYVLNPESIDTLETMPATFAERPTRGSWKIRGKPIMSHIAYYVIDEPRRVVFIIDIVGGAQGSRRDKYEDNA